MDLNDLHMAKRISSSRGVRLGVLVVLSVMVVEELWVSFVVSVCCWNDGVWCWRRRGQDRVNVRMTRVDDVDRGCD